MGCSRAGTLWYTSRIHACDHIDSHIDSHNVPIYICTLLAKLSKIHGDRVSPRGAYSSYMVDQE